MTGHGSHKAGNHIEALSAPLCVWKEKIGDLPPLTQTQSDAEATTGTPYSPPLLAVPVRATATSSPTLPLSLDQWHGHVQKVGAVQLIRNGHRVPTFKTLPNNPKPESH